MSNHTQEETPHHQEDNKMKSSSQSAFWFSIMMIGLFVALLNFVRIMNADEGDHGHEEAPHTETHHEPAHH